jgi:MoxR-like ATPase
VQQGTEGRPEWPVVPGPPAPGGERGQGPAPLASPVPVGRGQASARDQMAMVGAEVAKVVVGQGPVISGLVAALLVPGHVLLEGVPGVAKTLLARTLAASLDLRFARVQFTPDLMPSDVTGQVVYDHPSASFQFRKGPVFTDVLLADELNRTPPKTQAALLESMEERQVSAGGVTYDLPGPFIVLATQNPVEYEGTYPLPEAQLDRFLFKLSVPYPSEGAEREVLARVQGGLDPHNLASVGVGPVAGAGALALARAEVAAIRTDPVVQAYIVDLARATRVSPSVSLGVSTRGALMLMKAAKAWAWLSGRDFVTPDEVQAVARPALRHRLRLRPEAELEGVTADAVLDGILATVPVPR